MENLKGKRVLITGGTTGIGRATAMLLAQEGAKILIFGRHKEALADALEDLKSFPKENIYGMLADVSREADIKKVFKAVDEQLGGLDILINNAGLAFDSVLKGDYKDWQYILNTNLLGYLACCKAASDRMKDQQEGHIINIGSVSADSRGNSSSVYVATKSGIQGFSESFRKEVKSMGIKVTLIEPGRVGTDMQEGSGEEQRQKIEKLEMLEAEDIARSILYILQQPKRCNIVSLKIMPLMQD